MTLLEIDDLHTRFSTREGPVHAVNGVSFSIEEGEIVGIVGESGSGKSVTALSLMRLEDPGQIVQGSIQFKDTEMTTASQSAIRQIRGSGMSMVFQDPMETLNPVFTVSEQIAESIKVHESPDTQRLLDYIRIPFVSDRGDWGDKRKEALELMNYVGIPHPHERINAYPHEFSGGMRQRAMLAIALAGEPTLLVADEPTTALDVTIQAQILEKIKELNRELGMSVLLITHDLGVIAEVCDKVLVMYGGEIMESGTTEQILTNPRHPYTRSLLGCLPQTTNNKAQLNVIEGQVPSMIGGVDGCPFASRCEYSIPDCGSGTMPDINIEDGEDRGTKTDEHVARCCNIEMVPDDLVHTKLGGDSNE